jgi:hypothetical protein
MGCYNQLHLVGTMVEVGSRRQCMTSQGMMASADIHWLIVAGALRRACNLHWFETSPFRCSCSTRHGHTRMWGGAMVTGHAACHMV